MGNRRKPSRTRIVHYGFEVPPESDGFNDYAVEEILAKAWQAGVVTNYDSGRGHGCWLQGPPGAAIRAVRDVVQAVVDRMEGPYDQAQRERRELAEEARQIRARRRKRT